MQNEEITEKSLLEEMKIIIPDEFECTAEVCGGDLLMLFKNGQKFKVSVRESL